jgi:6-phosphogluconolactonase (cycloisomerase 2 family)
MASERLQIVSGPAAGQSIDVAGDFMIGRGETGMGSLQGDTEISRRHARFRLLPDGRLLVEDLDSTNGTYVNRQRISGLQVLNPGDQVQVGQTVLRLEGAPVAAEAVAPAPVAAQAVALPAAVAPAPVAPAAKQPNRPGGAAGGRYRRRGRALAALLALLLIAGALVGGIAIGKGSKDGKGSKPAGGAPAAAGKGAIGTVYIESNIAKPDGNTILAYQYRSGGDLHPMNVTAYPTRGSGSQDITDSGVLDADQHLLLSPQKKLLFAVNQGSDTVAVFHVAGDGGLTPVKGSPFPSGGKAPASVGLSGDTLVVVNKAQDGIRKLESVPPNYTTFKVQPDGSLKPAGSTVNAPAGNSPTQADVSPDGKVVISSEEGGPFRAFALSPDGKLTQGPNSPLDPPDSIYPPNFDPKLKWALGLGVHPTQKIVYAQMATINKMAVYTYDDTGKLTFVKVVPNKGGELPCWTLVNRAGTRVYTDNAGNNTMTVYDTTDPMNPKQLQVLKLKNDGNPWDVRFDPTEKYIFMVDPRARDNVKPGEGQEVHSLTVGGDGTLSEPTQPAPIPVELNTNPIGMAVTANR